MNDPKETNPKQTIGTRKVPFSVLPANVMAGVAIALLEGACKYGRHNYRVAGTRASTYYDGTRRHLDAWWEGEDIDADSSLNHIDKAIASLVVLRDSMLRNMMTDDRPPKSPGGWMEKLNQAVGVVLDKFPTPKAAYVETAAACPQVAAVPVGFKTYPMKAPERPPTKCTKCRGSGIVDGAVEFCPETCPECEGHGVK